MDVNVTKEKKLTNMRTTASDDNVILEAAHARSRSNTPSSTSRKTS